MPRVETAPSATAVQVSSRHPEGKWVLTILAKRTYTVDELGRRQPAREQPPLRAEPEWQPGPPDLLVADLDRFTHKLRTDVVVQGHVHGDGKARRLTAGVSVGGRDVELLVFGERRAALARTGGILFSEPAAIERVPLRYTHAYGGRDAAFEERHGNPIRTDPRCEGLTDEQIDAASPYLYPRNPAGRGYLIDPTPDAVERLQLPQLEDPADPLTPTRLAVGDALAWYRMPLPRGTDWIDYDWYPRIAFIGVVPVSAGFDAPPAEVVRGLVPAALGPGDGKKPQHHAYELASGASLPLQVPYLRGREPVVLTHIHPRRARWELAVPLAPELAVDGRDGRLRPVEPVLHTLLIEPDAGRLTVVWRGHGPAPRRYTPAELETMPMRVAWHE